MTFLCPRRARRFPIAVGLLLLPAIVAPARAQDRDEGSDMRIDGRTRATVIDSALARLSDRYVFPDRAEDMARAIRRRARRGEYDGITRKRVTVVGETTRGGAHPGSVARLDAHFSAFIPQGRAINPVSRTNWEGTGVTPDIPVAADDALRTAHLDALRRLLARAPDDAKPELEAAIAAVSKEPADGP